MFSRLMFWVSKPEPEPVDEVQVWADRLAVLRARSFEVLS